MRLLILGGTVFLGRHLSAAALARGHELTLFSRGRHGGELFADAEHLRGDRAGDLDALDGRRWDAAIDTSGYQPEQVAASSALLAGAVEHLVFVSSISAYRDWPARAVDEDSPLFAEGDDYAALKAGCERAAEAAMPTRVSHVRAGLICGPHDSVFRLPWWVARIGRGGDIVAPGEPRRGVQLIDARDLAAWMLDLAERRLPGAFNATAPIGHATMGDTLHAAVTATGSGATLHWIPDTTLTAAGVEPWDELPLWLPEQECPGTWQVETTRAQATGLSPRPIQETVADVWAWLRDGGEQELGDWNADARPRGLSPERERELLAAGRS